VDLRDSVGIISDPLFTTHGFKSHTVHFSVT
jgi:hypothetical protein